jgi:uncharacterized protein YaaW (UPF0174 family)
MTSALSWLAYLAADLIHRIFDQRTSIGMRGPIYAAYNRLMTWSVALQGAGTGVTIPVEITVADFRRARFLLPDGEG